jgi:fatty-acyl-CoA synthase
MLDAMAREPGFLTRDLSALRTIGAAGAPLPLPTLRTWLERGVTMQQCYGMTEAAPGCTVLDSADAERKVGSAGKPVFFTDVRVLRADGTEAGVDEIGEIVIQGPNVMAGYWNEPEQTAAVLEDGWYRSGDAGSVDDEGFLYVRDRYKDMIISGGENIYCAEVEDVLAAHPKVAEVALIGVPDTKYGEAPLAVVAPRDAADPPTAEELAAWCRERLARYKNPREYSIVGALPRNPSGKVLKTALRQEHSAGSLVAEPVV